MKKAVSSLLVFALFVNLSACSSNEKIDFDEPPKDPFSFDYPTDEEHLSYFTENDTLNMLISASPYYMGNQTLDLPAFVRYEALKKKKVDEAITLTNELTNSLQEYGKTMESFRRAYIELMDTVTAEDDSYKKFAQENGAKMLESFIKEEVLLLNIESISENISENPYAQSLLEYQKTMLALEVTSISQKDLAQFLSSAVIATELLKDHKNGNIQSALEAFESEMERIDNINPVMNAIEEKSIYLYTALKQIEAGEYYFAQASIAFIEEKMPEIQALTETLEVSEEGLVAEDIAFIQEYADLFESFSQELKTELGNIDSTSFPIVPEQNEQTSRFFIEAAKAEVASSTTDLLMSSEASLTPPSQNSASPWSKIGSALKTGASYTWSGVKTTVKATQTAVGVTLDTADAVSKSGFDIMFGAGNGNTFEEITGEIKNNFKKIKTNYDQDKSGADVLKEAGAFLDSVEDAPKNAIEGSFGEGWTSWAVGGVSKITIGMFTGFGKGVYKLANKQSTAGEIAEGMLDVGLSFIGGSKTIFQGAAGGGKGGLKIMGQKAINFLKRVANKIDRTQLKNLTKEILKKAKLNPKDMLSLITNSLELEGKKAIATQLKAINQSINKKFTKLLKDGLKGIVKNLKGSPDEIAKTYKGFAKEAFENSLKGIKESMIKVLGEGYEEYVDNLITSKMDEMIKAAIKVYIDAGKFDGVYLTTQSVYENIQIPLRVTIENGSISGGAEYSTNQDDWTASLSVPIEGIVNEKGAVSGEWTGILNASGPSSASFYFFQKPENFKECTDHIKVNGSGALTGSIVESTLTISLQGSITPNGTFFCEPIPSGTTSLEEEISFILKKSE